MYNYKYINFESSSTIIFIDKLIQGQTAESKVIGSNQNIDVCKTLMPPFPNI